MNKSSESYKVYLDKSPQAVEGVTSQPEVGGQSYPGRATPPVQQVEQAKDNPGTAVRLAKQQTGENRYPINSYDYEKSSHGPNN
jgi:hypothetical protein